MIDSFLRCCALAAIRLATALLPHEQRHWGHAMRHEIAAIESGLRAMLFATGCLGFALRQTLSAILSPGTNAMLDLLAQRPRLLTAFCATAATSFGLAYMALAGAPPRYLAMNAGALVVGLIVSSLLSIPERRSATSGFSATLGPILLLTSLFGIAVEGAARWISIAGLSVQLSLILLPVLTICYARTRDSLSTIGVVAAAMALAAQPDRAMAGALALAMAALAWHRRERNVRIALAASFLGFATTLIRTDTLPAVPFVDQILYSSFDVHPIAGVAVLGGMALLLVPAIVGSLRDATHREAYMAFGAVWLGIIAAAALGNYPTPVVGYGGSAILGYALSLLGLPRHMRSIAADQSGPAERRDDHAMMRTGLRLAR